MFSPPPLSSSVSESIVSENSGPPSGETEIPSNAITLSAHEPQVDPSQGPEISDIERRTYYWGLPSRPLLVGRSGASEPYVPKMSPIDPIHIEPKQLSVDSGNHPIVRVWMGIVSKLEEELKKADLYKFVTCIDCIRIGYTGGEDDPLVIWIGIVPEDLDFFYKENPPRPSRDYCRFAGKFKDYLIEKGIHGVEVEFREAIVTVRMM